MWIAEEAALADLPDGWLEGRDPSGDPYFVHAATGQASRAHPRDVEFRRLVAKAKLDSLHALAPVPSQGQWSTMQMRSVEQTLCASASTRVRALVQRTSAELDGLPAFSFELCLDADTQLDAFSATYRAGPSPAFELICEQPADGGGTLQARHTVVRVISRGKYVLMRAPLHRSQPLGGRREELAAAVFTEPVEGLHVMELVVPHGSRRSRDGVVAGYPASTPRDGLLACYERGETKGLLVFVGKLAIAPRALSAGEDAPSVSVRLSLPKTDSGNLVLKQSGRGGPAALASVVEYTEPVAPVQAFFAALSMMHAADKIVASSVSQTAKPHGRIQ